jgi:hypothetical protein
MVLIALVGALIVVAGAFALLKNSKASDSTYTKLNIR